MVTQSGGVGGTGGSTPISSTHLPSGVTSAGLAAHTIQALIELVYIQTANNVIASAMLKLDEALTTTQGSLNTLATLQTLHNDISVPSRGSFPFNYLAGGSNPGAPVGGTITVPQLTVNTAKGNSTVSTLKGSYTTQINNTGDYISVYDLIASSFYGRPIDPVFTVTVSDGSAYTIPSFSALNALPHPAMSAYNSFISSLKTARGQVIQEIQTLSGITPPTASGHVDQTSLYYKLQQVLKDLPSLSGLSASAQFNAVNTWVLDNYNQHGVSGVASQGTIEQNLTNAITAGESLNDTQKQAVRRYMFVFEEYYQSAASLISAITQILQKMAQNMGQ